MHATCGVRVCVSTCKRVYGVNPTCICVRDGGRVVFNLSTQNFYIKLRPFYLLECELERYDKGT